MVLKERKIYIPKDKVLRVEIIQLHHDIPVTRYSGRWKTTELVARSDKRYKKYVNGYNMCQRIKN